MGNQSILIVGAGPSGLTAAIELKRRGFHPRIIDKDDGPAPESRAGGINPRTLKILETCGLAPRLIEAGNRIQDFYMRGPNKLLFHGDLSILPKPYNFVLLLPQCDTERLMVARLGEMGGEVERCTQLSKLTQTNGEIRAELEGPNGEISMTTPDILIGADGAHSTTRHAIGQGFKGAAYEHKWGLADADIRTQLPLNGITVFDRAPDLFAMFPFGGNRVRLVSDQEDILSHVPPEITIENVAWVAPFRISHRLVDSYQSGNVFLVGDAAHIHSPFGGRGMNMGIEDAAWLAWMISEGHTTNFTTDRRLVARHVIEMVDPATRFMASDARFEKFLRRNVLPLVASWSVVQKKMWTNISAGNTPFPPWLKP